jgi:branched-chain amino acid transport system substrate-binding protein
VPRASVDCATNRECIARLGGPALCRHDTRACVPLESADCSIRAEPDDLANDETIWLGAIYPLSGPDAEDFGRAGANAFDLGRRDFREIAGGLPRRGSQGPARPIGIVLCDDARAPGSARDAAHHLLDVGVPAVVGFHRSEEAIDLATSFFLPNHVLVVSTLNHSPLVTQVPQAKGEPRLIWRTAVDGNAWAEPIAHVVSGVAHGRSLRVALVTGGTHNPAWLSFATALRGRLISDRGPSAADRDDVREVFVAKKAGGTDGVDTEGVVRDLLEAPPHVVVVDNSVFGDIASSLEAHWPTGLARPLYVGTGGMVYPSMQRYFGKDPDRRSRFLAPELVVGSKANVLLAARYNEFFQPRVTQSFSAAALGAPYDAFYLLAYAAFAAGDGPPDGMKLAEAIPRLLPPGPTVDVGPTGIFVAIRALANGGTVDLNGAATPLDFDPATGETPADWDVLCPGVDDSGAATSLVPSGLRYRAATRALEGRIECP